MPFLYVRRARRTSEVKVLRGHLLPVNPKATPKPDGGVRQLGIPTVMDRMIQQAIVQVISPICEPYFSEKRIS